MLSCFRQQVVCARHYDGAYKTFNNYCEMEYENCNGWRSKSYTYYREVSLKLNNS